LEVAEPCYGQAHQILLVVDAPHLVLEMSRSHDNSLLALLPTKDSPYSVDSLSQAETAALEASFRDGFGDVDGARFEALPIPGMIKSGLMRHSFFLASRRGHDWEFRDEVEEYFDHRPSPLQDEFTEEFDNTSPFLQFPLGFDTTRLRLYFDNQLDRFYEWLVRSNPDYDPNDQFRLKQLARYRLYEKPWYEFHAVRFLSTMDVIRRNGMSLDITALLFSINFGKLGRLVEQYYWRFRFERAAVAGVRARTGASRGGKTKAELHSAKRSAWNSLASDIWSRRPSLSKTAVAEAIRKQLNVPCSAKHIARFINRPLA
jgi:hypothetical protein